MMKNNIDCTNQQIDSILSIKKIIEGVLIKWEVDLEKMNFSDLRSHGFLNFDINDNYQRIRLDEIDISNEFRHFKQETFNMYFLDDITNDLINFIDRNSKIIPPLYEVPLEYCGETFKTIQSYPIHRLDGTHRVFVSYFSGLKIIPIVVAERVKKFSFPVEKWDFEYTNDLFTAINKKTKEIIELTNTKYKIDTSNVSDDTLIISMQ